MREKNRNKVLLVLGNGFDMKCGLCSSFIEFLNSEYYKSTIDKIKSLDEFLTKALTYPSNYDGYALYDDYQMIFDEDLTFWDLYYALPLIYNYNDINYWCDFEKRLNQFIRSIENNCEYKEIKDVYRIAVSSNSRDDTKYKRRVILYFYLKKLGKDVYKLLFDDLKKYEHKFGKYIKSEQNNKTDYESNSNKIIKEILEQNEEIVCINNFNYTDLSFITKNIWYINGDCDNPIFGIDLQDSNPNDRRFIYTKTYRRLELCGKNAYSPKTNEFNKVVICGHSLNEQDYSYFYSLFNTLGLDVDRGVKQKNCTIEFVYYKYNEKTSLEVRNETISKVMMLFYRYSLEMLNRTDFRLIDILYCTKAVTFKEIEI